jgi:hypothetical protein
MHPDCCNQTLKPPKQFERPRVLDLTIQKILRHSNMTTKRKSYIHHREHQVTAVIEHLAAGIEAENRRAQAERSAANQSAETVN